MPENARRPRPLRATSTHAMIDVTPTISIDENLLRIRFIRSSGPGGQNVNKVATAVQMHVPLLELGLSHEVLTRLRTLAGRRLNSDGELVISAQRFRTQERNRADALDRLVELIAKASVAPKPRRKTKPSKASKEKRLATKTLQGTRKRLRAPRVSDD